MRNRDRDIEYDQRLVRDPATATLEYRGVFYDLEELSHFSRETLLEIKLTIDQEIASLKSQIARAKAQQKSGMGYSDPVWFAKITSRLRHRGRGSQLVQTALRLIGDREKQKDAEERQLIEAQQRENFERQFINFAKLMLPGETFQRICALAKEATSIS